MKIHHFLWLCAASTLPQSVLAELPFTPRSLATTQSTLDLCSQINPGAARTYQDQVGMLVRGVSREELDNIRNTDEYKQEYARSIAALGEIAHKDADDACKGFLDNYK